VVTESITLYAKWEEVPEDPETDPATNMVIFDAMGGSAVPGQTVNKDSKATMPDSQKAGYSIAGWYLDRECSEGKEWNFEDVVTESITLYAKWEEVSLVPGMNLATKLAWLRDNALNGGEYIVFVDVNENIGPQTLAYTGKIVSITIKSDDASIQTINLSSNGELFAIDSGVTLTLENITLQGMTNNTNSLVSVKTGGHLIMNTGSKITGNTNSNSDHGNGSGVQVEGIFDMKGGEISGNIAPYGGGGGVNVYLGTFTMSGDAIISNNTANGGGGGVSIWNGTFTMTDNANISDNKANNGGGVYVGGDNGIFTMNGGMISGNIVDAPGSDGGGVQVGSGGTFTMKDGTIAHNTASQSGGGVHIWEATFIMESGSISGNNTNSHGGGVFVGGTFEMKGGVISGNSCPNPGGGVYVGTPSHNQSFDIFRISAGVIYGSNENDESLRNIAGSNVALNIYQGTAQRGTFNSIGSWIYSGNLNSSNNTIRVENGVLR
jgi:uncharacterized repeat protein (TIGR02543 family)